MGLKMDKRSRDKLLESLCSEYPDASTKRKSELLRTLIEGTGYSKKHAITLLNARSAEVKSKRNRPRVYDDEVLEALTFIWKASNMLCAKRLVPFMPEFLRVLENRGHLEISQHVRQKLLSISAATVDRLLAREKGKLGKSLSLTRAGNFLKSQIPIRTFTDWSESSPGFFEADLVAHCGGDPRGQFLQTLTLTDIHTQWTECIALLKRCEVQVIQALNSRCPDLPFPMKGIDTDNGGEFINYLMIDWCNVRQVTFTRSRQYKKNDQAHVEERNGSVVRRLVGYDRLEGPVAYDTLCELYAQARLFINFFQPSAKLLVKHRLGSKVYRRYDTPRTPFQRILASDCVNEDSKILLQRQYESLDPVALLASIRDVQSRLSSLASTAAPRVKKPSVKQRRHLDRVPQLAAPRREKQSVRSMVLGLAPGTVFKPVDLLPYASRHQVDQALSHMYKNGEVLRLSWGVYQTKQLSLSLLESTNLNEATVP